MPADDALATRVRAALTGTVGLTEKAIFGGLCFLVHGHLCAGIVGSALMIRVGPDGQAEAVGQPGVRPMDFTGAPMAGMVLIDPPALATDAALAAWVTRAARFVASLPPGPA